MLQFAWILFVVANKVARSAVYENEGEVRMMPSLPL